MLNYLEGSGTQYIDTGYSSDEGFKWDMLFEYTDEIISRYIIGSHGDVEPYGRNGFRYETNGSYWQLGLGDGFDNLVRNLSPCINSSGEVGLYDFVNNQFYGNSGTGTFKTV